ncbi:group II intron maturase-specific domain-containing protein [Mesorhizobium sp.]|uniref:group II intron maturase-specific domain-containing protein n=1 Tax=Mesorhizobium sp. TaxID=1871066 RepID=UPI0025C1C1DA|nr:group II intron maturase-specific domain-containing protein [Mesorhizobium sp.]
MRRGYFGLCQTSQVFTNLEAWIRRRLRPCLWRQSEKGHNRYKGLPRHGVPKLRATVAAGSSTGIWRMSGHPAVQQERGGTLAILAIDSMKLAFMELLGCSRIRRWQLSERGAAK